MDRSAERFSVVETGTRNSFISMCDQHIQVKKYVQNHGTKCKKAHRYKIQDGQDKRELVICKFVQFCQFCKNMSDLQRWSI
jgi:hypothetical protein